MSRVDITPISNLTGNPASATATLNANFAAIQAALEELLSRVGTSPNTMTADLDMNGHKILNAGNVQNEEGYMLWEGS